VKLIECEGIKSEPDMVIVDPCGPLAGDNMIDAAAIENAADAELVPSEAATE